MNKFAGTLIRKIVSTICVFTMVFCLVAGVTPVNTAAATATSWQASKDFSSKQGKKQWYYIHLKVRGDTVKYNNLNSYTTYSIPELGDTDSKVWLLDYFESVNTSKNTQVASTGDSAARAWKAPSTGKVLISGEACFTSGKQNSFGTDFRIILVPSADSSNEKVLWEETDYKSVQSLSHRFSVNVKKGDMVYFLATTNVPNTATRITWDPKIYSIPDKNAAPEFSKIKKQSAKAGYAITFSVNAADKNYDILTYTADNLPKGAQLNSKTGEFKWTPTKKQLGTYKVKFKVSDGELSDTVTVKVNVAKVSLTKIEITKKPTKTEYLTGDSLNLDGLVVTGIFKNGDKIILDNITTANVSGFNSNIKKDASQTLTVKVNNLTADFNVNIKRSPLVPKFSYRTLLPNENETVRVNQEVFFTAEESSYNGVSMSDIPFESGLLIKENGTNRYKNENHMIGMAFCEWNFGDGYTLEGSHNGSIVTHYYMRPGTYTVTLTIKLYENLFNLESQPLGDLLYTRSLQKTITVVGTEPLEGFELYHAPFSSRIAQFIIPEIPDTIAADKNNRLLVTLTGDNNTNVTLLDTADLHEEKKFLLEQRDLKKGKYALTAKLLDKNGSIITDGDKQGIWSEMFEKKCDGIPEVGINEWNAVCLNGEPYLPITPFMLNTEKFPAFEGCINALDCVGWYPSAPLVSIDHFGQYLDFAESKYYMVIGPSRGDYGAGRFRRNIDSNRLQEYVTASIQHDSFLMHDWLDEPNLGGNHAKLFLPNLSALKFLCDEADGQHPVYATMYGFNHLPYYNPYNGTSHDYITSTQYNARHDFFIDAMTSDIYPMGMRKHASLFNKERGIFDLWVESLDNTENNNMGLIPRGTFIEICTVKDHELPAPTNEQVLMEVWLAVIHGAKIINYFPFFGYSTIRYDAMKEFMVAAKTYDKIILGPSDVSQVTDNSNVRTNRVDTLTRVDGDDIYIFTARLTEPEAIEGETVSALPENKEPDSITTTFNVPGVKGGTVEVLDNSGKVVRNIEIKNGSFLDIFKKEAYRIYRIAGGAGQD